MLSWQGELLLVRSADKDVPVEFQRCGYTEAVFEPSLYDPDALGKKAVRWCKLRLASFLQMTAFTDSHKALAQIPKYPPGSFFSDSSYICRRTFDGFARTQQSD